MRTVRVNDYLILAKFRSKLAALKGDAVWLIFDWKRGMYHFLLLDGGDYKRIIDSYWNIPQKGISRVINLSKLY